MQPASEQINNQTIIFKNSGGGESGPVPRASTIYFLKCLVSHKITDIRQNIFLKILVIKRYMVIKLSIYQKDITIINMYVSNNRAPKYMKQKLTEIKGEGKKKNSTIIFGDLNTNISRINRTARLKINKKIEDMNSTINHLDLTDIYSILHTTAKYIFLSALETLQHQPYTKS